MEQWFGVPIGYKRLVQVNDEVLKFMFKQIKSHKEAFNESEQPKDYCDAYLHEMKRREATGVVNGAVIM